MKNFITSAILLIFIICNSCSDIEFNYNTVNCAGATEVTDVFTKGTLTNDDLFYYDYIIDYTKITLSVAIENACPSKPVKVDFSCHLAPSDSLPVYLGVKLYNGSNTQVGGLNLDWNSDVNPDLITGSGEFTVEGKSTETSFSVRIEIMVETTEVTEARNYLIECFKDYNISVTYSKLE